MPWHHFSSPAEQWANMPSFLIGEYAFIVLAAIALVHATRSGRDHLLIWLGALIAGTANDQIFMALPLVDNFWQAQATVMLTVRMPLYIPCVYVCFMYYPTVAVRRLGLDPWASAAAVGLLAMVFYAPYDIMGAKFMWWTWHDTDPPIDARLLGAPVSSSLWILTFVSTFSFLLDRAIRDHGAELPWPRFALGLALVGGLTTLVMMVQMTILQQLDGGTPRYFAYTGGVSLYVGVLIWRGREFQPRPALALDRLLYAAVVAYFSMFPLLMASFDPTTHRSLGVHQPAGECYVDEKDVTGLTRHKYLCVTDYEEDFTFECVDSPPGGAAETRWYTTCGKAHTNKAGHVAGVSILGAVGILLFSLLVGPLRRKPNG